MLLSLIAVYTAPTTGLVAASSFAVSSSLPHATLGEANFSPAEYDMVHGLKMPKIEPATLEEINRQQAAQDHETHKNYIRKR
jgi:hypothetical protein